MQYNKVTNGKTGIANVCETMANSSIGSPVQRLAKIINNKKDCVDIDYSSILNSLGNSSWSANSGMSKCSLQ